MAMNTTEAFGVSNSQAAQGGIVPPHRSVLTKPSQLPLMVKQKWEGVSALLERPSATRFFQSYYSPSSIAGLLACKTTHSSTFGRRRSTTMRAMRQQYSPRIQSYSLFLILTIFLYSFLLPLYGLLRPLTHANH